MTSPARSPVAVSVGKRMTGFGVGCGIGIGAGYPIALESVPLLGDLLSATSNASSKAFGGVGRQAFLLFGKFGIKNLKAGAGCGIGIGHGFGVGIALKPGVSRQLLLSFQEGLLGAGNTLRRHLSALESDRPQNSKELHPEALTETPSNVPSIETHNLGTSPINKWDPSHGDNYSTAGVGPVLSTLSSAHQEGHALEQQNDVLRALLRHQELIEDLKVQNASILQVLSEQLDVRVLKKQKDLSSMIEVVMLTKSRQKIEMLHAMHSRTPYPDQACFKCRKYSRRRK